MRKITTAVLFLIAFTLLAGCGKRPVPADPTVTDTEVPPTESVAVAFTAHYIRTDGYIADEIYPKAYRITSAGEWENYYEENKDRYDFDRTVNPELPVALIDLADGYDDAFFEKNDLIVLVLEEGSGSIRHEVTELTLVPDASGDGYTLRPVITRIVPGSMTEDMAEWHILIETEKAYGKTAAAPITPVIR